MAVTYTLAPIPKWYFADNFGRPLGAGKMYTYSNINKVQQKPVYQDSNGTIPWTNPILFNANGEQGPFYWSVDDINTDETYYIEVYDKDDVLQFTIEDYPRFGGGGGGGGTTFVNVKNLISNNIFLNNIGSLTPTVSTDAVIAPGAHFGFNPSMTDLRFLKTSAVNGTDILEFVNFNLGDDPFTDDTTPTQYLRYTCSAAGSDSVKCVQIPVTSSVSNLDNQQVTFTMWAKCGPSGANTLELFLYQFFGNGSASPSNPVALITFNLTTDWARYTHTFSIPSVGGKTLGLCGDDGLFLRIGFPLSAAAEISLAKPSLYIGSHDPGKDFATNDQVISEIEWLRTGDIRVSVNNFSPYGWVEMNDGTIGSASSGATTRANIDTFPLYKTLYINVTDTFAPVSGGRTGDPEADFAANKTIGLTKTLGRSLASVHAPSTGGTNWGMGQFTGSETHTLTLSEMPTHNHPSSVFPVNQLQAANGAGFTFFAPGSPVVNAPIAINPQGGNQPFSIMQPTVHYRIFIKL